MLFNKQNTEDNNDNGQQMNFLREQDGLHSAETISDQFLISQKDGKQDLLLWQQTLYEELDDLKHRLRREVKNEKGEWVKQKIPVRLNTGEIVIEELPPFLNENGVSMIESCVSPLLSKNMINSNITEERALTLLKRTSNDIVSNLAYYGEYEYQMEFGTFSTVVRIIKNCIIPTPFRAVNGWNKKIDSTISKRVEAYSEGYSRPEKKKIFGIF